MEDSKGSDKELTGDLEVTDEEASEVKGGYHIVKWRRWHAAELLRKERERKHRRM